MLTKAYYFDYFDLQTAEYYFRTGKHYSKLLEKTSNVILEQVRTGA